MKIQNTDVEYGIFFMLVGKRQADTYLRLRTNGVTPAYFSISFMRKLLKIAFAYLAKGKLITYDILANYYRSSGEYTEADDIMIESLKADVNNHKMKPSELDSYIDILVQCYGIRKLNKAMKNAADNEDHEAVGSLVEKIAEACRNYKTLMERNEVKRVSYLHENLEQRIKLATEVHNNPDAVGMILTGLKNIDKWIGRQSPGQLVIYQARTGTGKSMMLMGTAIANFRRGLKVIVITIEMSDTDYLYRFDSNLTGFEHREFAQGEIVTDPEKLDVWRKKILKTGGDNDLPVYWVPDACTPDRVEDIIKDNPFKPDLVIVDYAGDMKAGLPGVPDFDARSHAHIYSRLKEIAGKYNCVVYTAQQSKRGTKGKASTETGSWSDEASAKADLMMAVEVTKEDEDYMTKTDNGSVVIGRMTVSIIKGRNVPRCKTYIIPRFSRMSWLEKVEDEMMGCGNGKELKMKGSNNKAEEQLKKKQSEEKEPDILAGE